MKIARVMITKKCNLKCNYCCNEWDGMYDTFKPTTESKLKEELKEYDGINITGGEPLLYGIRLVQFIRELENDSIRIYTNGTLLTFDMFHYLVAAGIDKFEIGIHRGKMPDEEVKRLMITCSSYFRISINDEHAKEEIEFMKFAKRTGVEINEWKMDECDNDDTSRFLIIGGLK